MSPTAWHGEDAGKDAHDAIHYQGDYVKELIAETDYPSFDVDGACEAFFEWKDHKKQDIMTFRNHAYNVGHHRHDGAGPPHAVEGRAGGFDGKLSQELIRPASCVQTAPVRVGAVLRCLIAGQCRAGQRGRGNNISLR
jgi:hypothetical protein